MSGSRPPILDRIDAWRIGAMLVFVGLPALFATVAVTSLIQAATAIEEAGSRTDTLARIQDQLRARRAQIAPARDVSPLYLASTSASLAQAELQSLLTRQIEAAGGRLVETQVASEALGAGHVGLEATLDIGNDGLVDVLHALETALPILTIQEIDVVRAARDEGPGDDVSIRVHVLVQGFWRGRRS